MIRGMEDLEEYLTFSWAAAGLLGIHLFEPYLNLIIDCNTPHSDLLKIFPEFYFEMLQPGDLCQIDAPGLKSLEKGWHAPYSSEAPYEKDVINSLVGYLDTADKVLLNQHLREILALFASGFADQKGEAYGFGPKSGQQQPGHVLNQGITLDVQVFNPFKTRGKCIW